MLIGEVARRSGVSTRMLRHYDALGLVTPSDRTTGGYREYSADDIQRIFRVETLRSIGLPLREVGRALDDPSFGPADPVADLIAETEQRIAREQELLARLRVIDSDVPADWDDVLQIIGLMQGLGSADAGLRQRAALSVPPGEDASVELLARAALSESNTNVAGAIRWALAQAGSAGLTALADGLTSADPGARARTVLAVREFSGGEATAILRRALSDSDGEVRRLAALALGAKGDRAAAPALIELIVQGTDDVEAAELLAGLVTGGAGAGESVAGGEPHSAGQVVRTLVDRLGGSESDAATRIRLAQALAELPGTESRGALLELSTDSERTVALTAASILSTREQR